MYSCYTQNHVQLHTALCTVVHRTMHKCNAPRCTQCWALSPSWASPCCCSRRLRAGWLSVFSRGRGAGVRDGGGGPQKPAGAVSRACSSGTHNHSWVAHPDPLRSHFGLASPLPLTDRSPIRSPSHSLSSEQQPPPVGMGFSREARRWSRGSTERHPDALNPRGWRPSVRPSVTRRT